MVGFGPCDNPVMPQDWELALRLLAAAGMGGLIGFEREIRDQPAGFRTHILVAVGSCLFAIISAYGFDAFLGFRPEEIRFDPSRIAAQIVTGIGFLGAGAIIRYGMTVRGLTTAASLWIVAAIGLAVAVGQWATAGTATAITLVALWALRRIRPTLTRGLKPGHEEFLLELESATSLESVVRHVHDFGLRIDHLRVEEGTEGERMVSLALKVPPHRTPEDVAALLTETPGIRHVDWTR